MKKGRGLRTDLLEMYHGCLHVILKELKDLQEEDASSGQGTKMYVSSMGGVHLHFELAMVIGDTIGHDSICGCSYTEQEPIHQVIDECIYNINH